MAARLGFFLAISLSFIQLHLETAPELVVWNVGQGQWATLREDERCWHFDTGGEFAPIAKIRALCRGRDNPVSLSHWDEDHIGFLGRAARALPRVCRLHSPVGEASERKMTSLARVPACAFASPFASWVNEKGRTANDRSWVHIYRGVLAPGDSPRAQEKFWIHHLPLTEARILVLGHHGSRTSTSRELLFYARNLKEAAASARFRRYRHPHEETVMNLRRRKIPLLRTEEWGNIHIYL